MTSWLICLHSQIHFQELDQPARECGDVAEFARLIGALDVCPHSHLCTLFCANGQRQGQSSIEAAVGRIRLPPLPAALFVVWSTKSYNKVFEATSKAATLPMIQRLGYFAAERLGV